MPGKPEVLPAFVTPILVWEDAGTPEFNAQLVKLAQEKRAAGPGEPLDEGSLLKGGWRSTNDALQWDHPAITALKQMIATGVRDMINTTKTIEPKPAPVFMEGWINIMPSGAYIRQHDHHPAALSGVYYPQVGKRAEEDKWSGGIQFLDPRSGIASASTPGKPFVNKVRVLPKNAMMLIYPGWLRHLVYPYSGDGERISIAFNIEFGSERKDED